MVGVPNRRTFLKAVSAVSAAAAAGGLLALEGAEAASRAAAAHGLSSLSVFIPRDYDPPSASDTDFRAKLSDATFEALQAAYGTGDLPIWGKTLAEIGPDNMKKRLTWLAHWTLKGIDQNRDVWPVDPALMVANMWVESGFYEFAVSPALAVGPCQMMRTTARGEYGMLCGGDRAEHGRAPYRRPELAGTLDQYVDLIKRRRQFVTDNGSRLLEIAEVRRMLPSASGVSSGDFVGDLERRQAESAAYEAELADFDRRIDGARTGYRDFLQANFDGRDIFDDGDMAFLLGFEQRVTYRHSVPAMVNMFARNLRARKGAVLPVTAAYNVGLSNTKDGGHYGEYGRIPGISETARYVSRVAINHHEIAKRL